MKSVSFVVQKVMLNNCWRQQDEEKCPVQHYFYFWRTFRKYDFFVNIKKNC